MLVKTVQQQKEGQSVDDLITQVVIQAAQGGVEKIKIRYSVINDLIQSIQVVEKLDKTVITCKANVQDRIKMKSRLPGRTRLPSQPPPFTTNTLRNRRLGTIRRSSRIRPPRLERRPHRAGFDARTKPLCKLDKYILRPAIVAVLVLLHYV